jgi:hypothetical protein
LKRFASATITVFHFEAAAIQCDISHFVRQPEQVSRHRNARCLEERLWPQLACWLKRAQAKVEGNIGLDF